MDADRRITDEEYRDLNRDWTVQNQIDLYNWLQPFLDNN